MLRQSSGQHRVEHRIPGDQNKVVDRIFFMCFFICQHCRKCRLAPRSGRSRDRDEQRNWFQDLQLSPHGRYLFTRPCHSGADSFGTVHRGTAAERDDRVTVVFTVQCKRLLHIGDRRVCHCFVIYRTMDAGFPDPLHKLPVQSKGRNTRIRHKQDIFDSFFLYYGRQLLETVPAGYHLWLSPERHTVHDKLHHLLKQPAHHTIHRFVFSFVLCSSSLSGH